MAASVDPLVPLSATRRTAEKWDDDYVAYYIGELWRASREYYSVEREYLWPRNQHLTYGRQWSDWNPIERRWFPVKQIGRERKATRNHLLGRMNQMAARLVSSKPVFSVLPNRPTQSSRAAARLGERILDYSWKNLSLFHHRYLSIIQMIVYGLGVMKFWYDPNAGEVDVEREIVLDENLSPVSDSEVLEETGEAPRIRSAKYKGKIRCEAISPISLHPPPGVFWPILDICPYLVHESQMTAEEIWDRYKVEVNPAERPGIMGFTDTLHHDLERYVYYGFGKTSRDTERIPVLEYYEPASPVKGFEQGKVITVAGDKVVDEDSSQFRDGRYPFALFPGVPEPGRFFPHAWISDIVDPQISYNQTVSRLKKWEGLLFEPKALNPTTSGIPDRWFGSSLKVLPYDQFGGKPEWWVPPNPPESAWQGMALDIQDMDRISMQFGFSRGEQVQGSPSGALAQLMVEADATELGPLIAVHARSWERIGQSILELHRTFLDEEKLMVFSGDTGIAEIETFKKLDIPFGLIVDVQEDSLVPRIKSARVQAMRELVREGFYGNVLQDQKMRRKLLEYAGQPTALLGADTPEMNARRIAEVENVDLIERGRPVSRRPVDDDEVHLEVHLDRSNQVDSFEWSEETWNMFLAHVQEHEASLMETQQANEERQFQMQQRLRGIESAARINEAVAKVGASTVAKPKEPEETGNGGDRRQPSEVRSKPEQGS